jgi:hypothetical protein
MRGQSFVVGFVGDIEHDVDEVESGKESWRQVDVLDH